MLLTPSMIGALLAGICLWLMFWADLQKIEEIPYVRDFISTNQCLDWIQQRPGLTLLLTIVETGQLRMPFLIAAPTMRVPMVLGAETTNPYLAIRAVFLLVKHGQFAVGEHTGEKISQHIVSIAFPGMGTGVGRVPAEVCAKQMRTAIEEFVLDKFRLPQSWAEASERHQLLYTDRPRRLQ